MSHISSLKSQISNPQEQTRQAPEAWLGQLLRATTPVATRPPDATFNSQILATIRTEITFGRVKEKSRNPLSELLRIQEVLILAAACVASACVMLFAIRSFQNPPAPEIVSVRVTDDRIAASAVGGEDGMTVLWITGLRPLAEGEFRPRQKLRVN